MIELFGYYDILNSYYIENYIPADNNSGKSSYAETGFESEDYILEISEEAKKLAES